MSYVRNDSLMYQMPVHFGPCVTPRQNKEGKRFIYDQATRLTKHTIAVSYTHLDVYKRQRQRRT